MGDPDRLPSLLASLRSALDPLPAAAPPPPPPPPLQLAAVLLLLDPGDPALPLLFIERGPDLRNHPGQIAFPGGGYEAADGHLGAAALRETEEELGIPADAVELIGSLPPRRTHASQFLLTPFVGLQHRPVRLRPNPGEIADWFRVPLGELLQGHPPSTREVTREGEVVTIYSYQHGPHTIWGITAGILHTLLERLAPAPRTRA